MEPEPPPPPVSPGVRPPVRREYEGAYAEARDNRALSAGLAGTSIAILTFFLFFTYAPWKAGTINAWLFQWALLNIVTSVFLISLGSMNFWFVMEALRSNHQSPETYIDRAEGCFGGGWLLLTLEPTLILVTVGLFYAGAIALVFWVVVLLTFVSGWRHAR